MLPFENDTRTIEKKIAAKSFLADKMRNIFAITAIIMTTILFTGLFTLGLGLKESTQRADMILSGGDGHARMINMSESEYEAIRVHPSVQEIAYCRKLADSIDNKELGKRETVFQYYDDIGMNYEFVNPSSGHRPTKANEIIADTETLQLLGVPQEVGAEVTLELSVHGKKAVRSFRLSGWWESYPGVSYGMILTSRAYVDAYEEELVNTFRQDRVDTGTITAIIKFEETTNLEDTLKTVVEDSGYSTDNESQNYINAGVNPRYLSSEESTQMGTILALVCVLMAFILTGYLIIYNVFQISVLKDLHFYGLLKTIGTTQRQIDSMIRRQVWKLSLIGIPVGLCGGFLIGKALLPVLISQSGFSGAFATVSLNPFIFITSAVFALFTVRFSIRKPVKMAAKVSPVEALRFTDQETDNKKRKKKKTKSGSPQRRMALGNLGRNKKRTMLVVLSLSLSMVLANAVFHIAGSMNPEKSMKNMIASDFTIGQSSLLDYYEIDEKSALSESFIQAVEQQAGFVKGGRAYGSKAEYTSETTVQENNRTENGSFSTHLYGLDGFLISKLEVMDGALDMERFSSGKYILEGAFANTRGEIDYSSINHEVGDTVRISCNGEAREFTVLAHVIANESNTYDWVNSCFFLPGKAYMDFTGNHVMTYHFDVEQGKEEEMDAFLKQYTNDVEPAMTYKSKDTIIAGVADMQNMVISIGGTMALIIGIVGILNFVNTILTSIFTRRRELATLQSVGMTSRQMMKMLRWEGCDYIILTAIISIPLCIISTWMLVRPICEKIWFLEFQVTVWPLCAVLLLMILTGMAMPYIAHRTMTRQSITERLKGGE